MVSCPNCNQKIEDDVRIIQSTKQYRCKNCGKRLKLHSRKSDSPSESTSMPSLGSNFEDLDLDLLNNTDAVGFKKPQKPASSSKPEKPKQKRTAHNKEKQSTSTSKKRSGERTVKGSAASANQDDASRKPKRRSSKKPKVQPPGFSDIHSEENQPKDAEVVFFDGLKDPMELPLPPANEQSRGGAGGNDDDLLTPIKADAENQEPLSDIDSTLPTVVLGDPGLGKSSVSLLDNGQKDVMAAWGLQFLAREGREAGRPTIARELRIRDKVEIKPFTCPICDSPLMAKTGQANETVVCHICDSSVPVPVSHAGGVLKNQELSVTDHSTSSKNNADEDLPLEIPDGPLTIQPKAEEQKLEPAAALSPKTDTSNYDPDAELTLAEPTGEEVKPGDNLGNAYVYGAKELEVLEDEHSGEDNELQLAPLESHQKEPEKRLSDKHNIPDSPAMRKLRGPTPGDDVFGTDGELQELEKEELDLPEIVEDLDLPAPMAEAIPEDINPNQPSVDSPIEVAPARPATLKTTRTSPSEPPPFSATTHNTTNTKKSQIKSSDRSSSDHESSVRGKEKTPAGTSIFEKSFFYNWKQIAMDPVILVGTVVNSFVITFAQIIFRVGEQFFSGDNRAIFFALLIFIALPSCLFSIVVSSYLIANIADHDYEKKKKLMEIDWERLKNSLLLIGVPSAFAFLGLGGAAYLILGTYAGVIVGSFFAFVLAPMIILPSIFAGRPLQVACDEITLARTEDPKEWYIVILVGGIIWVFALMGLAISYFANLGSVNFSFMSVPLFGAYLSVAVVVQGAVMTRFLDVTEELASYRK